MLRGSITFRVVVAMYKYIYYISIDFALNLYIYRFCLYIHPLLSRFLVRI